jgi:hypothetical protein
MENINVEGRTFNKCWRDLQEDVGPPNAHSHNISITIEDKKFGNIQFSPKATRMQALNKNYVDLVRERNMLTTTSTKHNIHDLSHKFGYHIMPVLVFLLTPLHS